VKPRVQGFELRRIVYQGHTMVTTLLSRLAMAWHDLVRELTDSYRPELHYMRGPGPKWREKNPDQQ
jgi:hypothetical protein